VKPKFDIPLTLNDLSLIVITIQRELACYDEEMEYPDLDEKKMISYKTDLANLYATLAHVLESAVS
jgi:hypothetical protein